MSASPSTDTTPRWEHAWRIEVDASERVRRLKRFRLGTAIGSLLAGIALLAIFLGPIGDHSNVPLFVIYIFAGYLFTLAPASWFALSWSLRRITDKIAFDDDGILVHVADGTVVEVPWKDPEFSVDLVNPGAGDFTRGTILLTSTMKQRLPHAIITVDGAAALRSEALGRGLHVEARVEGRAPKLWGTVEMRPRGPESSSEMISEFAPGPPDVPASRSLGQ
jgi:hypothetical protein